MRGHSDNDNNHNHKENSENNNTNTDSNSHAAGIETGTVVTAPEPRSGFGRWFAGRKRRVAAIAAACALGVGAVAGACSVTSNGESGEGSAQGEAAEAGHGSEGGGLGEAAEAGHGGEAGMGEAAEGGNVTVLGVNETFDETARGARLRIAYDAGSNSFIGTIQNTTNQTLTRARVEIHLSNGTELGPTTPTDIAPGQVLDVVLPSTAAGFDTWTAHAEVGSGEAGEGGGEGSEGAGHESGGSEGDAEGTEGGQGGLAGTYLTSTGVSRGTQGTQPLAPNASYAGIMNDLEVAVSYDPGAREFVGRVKNEANAGLCDVKVAIATDGQPASQSVLIPALDPGGRADFAIDAPPGRFATWQVETETFTCTATASHPGEGGEGGSEGGNEGSGEGPGHESGGSEGGGEGGAEGGEETSPSTPIGQRAIGNFNNLDYNIGFDRATRSFRGTVTNNTNQTVCGSRLEVHMATGGQVIELGPTVGIDLAPGQSLDMVLAAPVTPDTYSLHPESDLCPGQAASANTSAGTNGEGAEGPGHETAGNESRNEGSRSVRESGEGRGNERSEGAHGNESGEGSGNERGEGAGHGNERGRG